MARLVMTQVDILEGFKIVNLYKDGTSNESDVMLDSVVENLSFAGKNEKITVTGKVTGIEFKHKKYPTKNFVTENSNTENDVTVETVTMDCSEKYQSKTYTIDAREILEFNPIAGKEIVRVYVKPIIKVVVTATLSDDSSTSLVITEGDTLFNVTFLRGAGKETTGDFKVSAFIYAFDDNGDAYMTGLYLVGPSGTHKVDFTMIKSCGKEGIVVEDPANLETVLEEFFKNPTDTGIVIPGGECQSAISVAGSVEILGNKASVVANAGKRRTDEIADDETVLKGVVTLSKKSDITITGVTLSGAANIKVKGAGRISFKNCKFTSVNPEKAKSFLIYDEFNNNDEGTLIQIENCYFGTNIVDESGKTYNLMELNCKVADGSYIKNCYFAKAACTHNAINLYDVVNGATIDINDNYFELSANACRIGFIGAVEDVTVNFNRNTYKETDTDPAWEGLLLIQPYGTRTTSFAGLTVNLNNTRYEGGDIHQVWYLYCGGSDTKITEETAPNVYVDGVKSEIIFE